MTKRKLNEQNPLGVMLDIPWGKEEEKQLMIWAKNKVAYVILHFSTSAGAYGTHEHNMDMLKKCGFDRATQTCAYHTKNINKYYDLDTYDQYTIDESKIL